MWVFPKSLSFPLAITTKPNKANKQTQNCGRQQDPNATTTTTTQQWLQVAEPTTTATN
jgi:hypothetical protein